MLVTLAQAFDISRNFNLDLQSWRGGRAEGDNGNLSSAAPYPTACVMSARSDGFELGTTTDGAEADRQTSCSSWRIVSPLPVVSVYRVSSWLTSISRLRPGNVSLNCRQSNTSGKAGLKLNSPL